MKTEVPCFDCKKTRLVETNGMLLDSYVKKSPVCRSCGALRAKDKISKTWFKKGFAPWHKGTRGLVKAWNKGMKGIHLSPKSEFKYKNGTGYRHLLLKGILPCCCSFCDEKNIKRLQIHHIDKNRLNNKMNNLMVLCRPCHLKEHGRTERKYTEGRKALYA